MPGSKAFSTMSAFWIRMTSTLASLKSSQTIGAHFMNATSAKSHTLVALLTANKKWIMLRKQSLSLKTLGAKIASWKRLEPARMSVKSMGRRKLTGSACSAAPLLSFTALVLTTCAISATLDTLTTGLLPKIVMESIVRSGSHTLQLLRTRGRVILPWAAVSADLKKLTH